jgi:hypothetical protein
MLDTFINHSLYYCDSWKNPHFVLATSSVSIFFFFFLKRTFTFAIGSTYYTSGPRIVIKTSIYFEKFRIRTLITEVDTANLDEPANEWSDCYQKRKVPLRLRETPRNIYNANYYVHNHKVNAETQDYFAARHCIID